MGGKWEGERGSAFFLYGGEKGILKGIRGGMVQIWFFSFFLPFPPSPFSHPPSPPSLQICCTSKEHAVDPLFLCPELFFQDIEISAKSTRFLLDFSRDLDMSQAKFVVF